MTDEQIDALIMSCPMEGYGLLAEMPDEMRVAEFRTTLRRWARAILVPYVSKLTEANNKWRDYEQNFILPCFKWADEVGFDLRAAVRANPGKNCVQLLVEHLRGSLPVVRRYDPISGQMVTRASDL